MGRPRKYIISFSDAEVADIKKLIRSKKYNERQKTRLRLLLDLDDAHGKYYTHAACAKANGVVLMTVTNTVYSYAHGGIDAVLKEERSVNSDNARRKLDGRAEAEIIAIACGEAPAGHERWTLRLLADRAKVVLENPVGKDAIARALKKLLASPPKRLLVHPAQRKRGFRSQHGRCTRCLFAALQSFTSSSLHG